MNEVDTRMVQAIDAFWNVVQACLLQFHGLGDGSAIEATKKARGSIEDLARKAPDEDDTFYHSEPFYVACDIAGNPLDLEKYDLDYTGIVEKCGW